MGNRGEWKNRSTFIMAAIGSAVGLGNIWRFPYVCAENGGGAFLIAYACVLILTGGPILLSELSIGHQFRRSICGAFGKIRHNFEFLGWLVVGIAFCILSYYVVVMSWSYKYVFDSFTLAWGNDPQNFFSNVTLGESSGPFELGGIKIPLLISYVIAWITILICVWKGPETIGKVMHTLTIVPAIILTIMVIRGVTMEGASTGLAYYLTPDFSALCKGKVWLAAFTQVFFSLGVGSGAMVAYGSYLPRKTNFVSNTAIIVAADTLSAFVGGLAVFGALGYLSCKTGTPIEQVVAQGPGLAFVAYPEIINILPMFNKTFGVMFFTMLALLALDSAFAMVEGITSTLRDKFRWSHKKSNLLTCLVISICGIPFITGSGVHWIHTVDYFVTQYGLMIACLLECLLIGWFLKPLNIINHVNSMEGMKIGSLWSMLIKYISPIILTLCIILEINTKVTMTGFQTQDVIGISIVFIILPTIALMFYKAKAYNKI